MVSSRKRTRLNTEKICRHLFMSEVPAQVQMIGSSTSIQPLAEPAQPAQKILGPGYNRPSYDDLGCTPAGNANPRRLCQQERITPASKIKIAGKNAST